MSRRRKSEKMSSNDQFIGRTELLDWINDTLQLKYKKVEDCANGAAFCQIVDMVHPGTVPLSRLNFLASLPHESMENLKILQEVFTKNGMTAIVDVSSLSKGRYVAALNVLQFLYQYVKTHYQTTTTTTTTTTSSASTSTTSSNSTSSPRQTYDPIARRKQFHLPEDPSKAVAKPKVSNCSNTINRGGVPVLDKSLTFKKRRLGTSTTVSSEQPEGSSEFTTPPGSPNSSNIDNKQPSNASTQTNNNDNNDNNNNDQLKQNIATIEELNKKLHIVKKQNHQLREDYDLMTQERDFYYEKLRKVEEFCQDNEEEAAYRKIFDILYETDAARGFVPPDEAELNADKLACLTGSEIVLDDEIIDDSENYSRNINDDDELKQLPDDFEAEGELPQSLKGE